VTFPRPLGAVLLCAGAILVADSARADSEDQAAAETLFADGRRLLAEGNIPEACRKFSESYRLDHAGGSLLNLALCHEKQGKVASAWAEYREAATLARRGGRTDREQIASESAEALEPRLPKLVVVVPAAVHAEGVQVTRNGTLLQPGSWGTALPVDPGEVRVEARAPGRKPWKTKLSMAEGQSASVTIPPLAVDEAALRARAPGFWTPRKTLASVEGVMGLAGIGVGAFLGVAALSSKQEASAACPTKDGEVRCTVEGSSDSHRAVTQAWASNIAFAVGGLALATGVVLFATDRPASSAHHERPPREDRPRLEGLSLGLGGASLRVRW
jgi:hypothetical protein